MSDEVRIPRELAQAAAQLIHLAIHPTVPSATVEQIRLGLITAIATQSGATKLVSTSAAE